MSRAGTFALALVAMVGLYLIGWTLPIVAALGNRQRAEDAALGLDVVLNVLTGGRAPEFLSSRADRAKEEGRAWGRILCGLLDLVDCEHCSKSRGKRWTRA